MKVFGSRSSALRCVLGLAGVAALLGPLSAANASGSQGGQLSASAPKATLTSWLQAQSSSDDPSKGEQPARSQGGIEIIPALGPARPFVGPRTISPGATYINELESNDTFGTAQPLTSNPVRVRGDLFKAPFSAGVDQDFYAFTAGAGDRVYAATMTGFSGGSTDTLLAIIGTDGTTVLESDDEDGTVGGSASNIAGTLLASAGTYYVRVTQFATSSLSGTIRPYDLYVRVLSGSPTAETEPNNNGAGGPQALAANGWMSGTIDPAADNDTYAVMANAGDTIVTILDVDPERDSPEWNARVAIGLFNNNFLVANGSAVGGTFDDANPSEAFFMTAKTTGAHQVYVDEALSGGAPGDTYNLAVFVIPANAQDCKIYDGTGGPITDLATTDFTLSIPDSKIIDHLQLRLNETHIGGATADLDVSLIAPDGNEVVLFDDPPTSATAAAPQIDLVLEDEAAIPISLFGIHSGMHYTPELYSRLAYFKGQQAQGTWTLRIKDDLAGNTGTLNSWSLTVCETPTSCLMPVTTPYSNDFEAGDGGFTHSGTQDEWARGTPSGASAPITTAHSGTNAWKTDLTGTYNNSSNQELLSPNINLTGLTGLIRLSWWQKYNIESASFDPAWVEVREVGNPGSARKVWEWKGATQSRSVGNPATTVQMSGGWGLVNADISGFANKIIEVRFHLESDTSGQFSGLAVDDVVVAQCSTTAATLRSFKAKAVPKGVTLSWKMASELGVAGYNVYGEARGNRVKLNRTLIAGNRAVAGGTYRFTHRPAKAARPYARYWLQGVSTAGSRTWYGSASIR